MWFGAKIAKFRKNSFHKNSFCNNLFLQKFFPLRYFPSRSVRFVIIHQEYLVGSNLLTLFLSFISSFIYADVDTHHVLTSGSESWHANWFVFHTSLVYRNTGPSHQVLQFAKSVIPKPWLMKSAGLFFVETWCQFDGSECILISATLFPTNGLYLLLFPWIYNSTI